VVCPDEFRARVDKNSNAAIVNDDLNDDDEVLFLNKIFINLLMILLKHDETN